MGKFFRKYQDAVLILAALVLFGIIAAYFIWGISFLIVNLNNAANPGQEKLTEQSQFNIEAAKEILKKRGLAN